MDTTNDSTKLPLNPAAYDLRAAMADTRLILGAIRMLEQLDESDADDALYDHVAQIEAWIDAAAPAYAESVNQDLIRRLLR